MLQTKTSVSVNKQKTLNFKIVQALKVIGYQKLKKHEMRIWWQAINWQKRRKYFALILYLLTPVLAVKEGFPPSGHTVLAFAGQAITL